MAGLFVMFSSMRDVFLINAIKRLIMCGLTPDDAFLACDDFLKKYGKADLDAFVRAVEVSYVAHV